MPMILALNGADYFGDFGELGAASRSQAIVDLQSALVALGKGIRDGVLMKIVVDGLIGPKTVAAVNRAMTVHLGVGQAPANLRTGMLSQQMIVSQAGSLTDLITAEIRRRGFAGPVAKKASSIGVAAKKKAVVQARAELAPAPNYAPVTTPSTSPALVATSPIYRVPAPTPISSGMDMNAIVKWSAIGVGVVVAAGIAYYVLTKRSPSMAGFAGEGERGHPFRLRWFPANQAWGVVWGDQHVDIRGRFLFTTKAEARAALTAAGLKLTKGDRVESLGLAGLGYSDSEREQWINNDEGLYNWYRSETRRRGSGGMRGFIQRNKAKIDAAIDRVLNRNPGLGELPRRDLDTLESLVDKQGGIPDVIDGLSNIAGEKAEHLRSNWQDEHAAKRWEQLGRRLDRFAVSLKGKGFDVP